MSSVRYQDFVELIKLDPEYIVYIKGFGPAVANPEKFNYHNVFQFHHYFIDGQIQLIDENNFENVVVKPRDLSPEAQYILALLDTLVRKSSEELTSN